jgi:hypothetical protein
MIFRKPFTYNDKNTDSSLFPWRSGLTVKAEQERFVLYYDKKKPIVAGNFVTFNLLNYEEWSRRCDDEYGSDEIKKFNFNKIKEDLPEVWKKRLDALNQWDEWQFALWSNEVEVLTKDVLDPLANLLRNLNNESIEQILEGTPFIYEFREPCEIEVGKEEMYKINRFSIIDSDVYDKMKGSFKVLANDDDYDSLEVADGKEHTLDQRYHPVSIPV